MGGALLRRSLAMLALAALVGCNGGAASPPPFPTGSAPALPQLKGTITEFSTGAAQPWDIAAGSDGNVWFTEFNFSRLGRITPAGQVTEFPYPAPFTSLNGIAAGPDGNLWFTEGQHIGRMTPSGAVTLFTIPARPLCCLPARIAAGPDGNMWFTLPDAIGRISPAGDIVEFTSGIAANANIIDITAGPDGNMWFTENNTEPNRLGRITPAGVVTEFPTGAVRQSQLDPGRPHCIAAGADGNLWFTEDYGNRISRMTTTGVVTRFSSGLHANPFCLTGGPDGNIWFTEDTRVGRITAAGAITEFDGMTGGAARITSGPNATLWVTELFSGRIARVQ